MKLALVQLLQKISKFARGLELMLSWRMWRCCTDFNDLQYTNPIIIEQVKLIVDMLVMLEDAGRYDECQEIIDVMIDPILNRFWHNEEM